MDFPDPEEEFELMHADELEMIREMEEDYPVMDVGVAPRSKRSLDFSSPKVATVVPEVVESQQPLSSVDNGAVSLSQISTSQLDGSEGRKRKIEYLFGDIEDIEEGTQELEFRSKEKSKKQCFSKDPDDDIVEQIMAQRRYLQAKRDPYASMRNYSVDGSSEQQQVKKQLLVKRVPTWAFIPVTCDGERLYARLKSEECVDREISSISAKGKAIGLLTSSFQTLWQQAERYLNKKLDNTKSTAEQQPEEQVDSGCETMDEDEEGTTALWVEKYRPRSYLQLLSDEGINRSLLQWLKLWDKVVFNREKKVKPKVKDDKKDSKFEKKFQNKSAVIEELDDHGRPQQKMALLCGPPGLGKTTLAHMIAKHAGYNVVEVNASDDRSPEVFRTQLEAATQMKSVMGNQPRPNCLILDEIDGAPAPSIDVLVKFIDGKGTGKGKGKKKGAEENIKLLRRPIICICNDVYVPALRPLRQSAFIIHFPPTASARLAQRLLEICRKQRLKTDLGALLALCEKTQNDIRSCLSALHFFRIQGKELRLRDVQKSNIGQKDMQKTLFAVWQEIFQIPRPKRNRYSGSSPENGQLLPIEDSESVSCGIKMNKGTEEDRLESVLRTVQCCGEYERLVQGVFENYLHVKIKDSTLESVVTGANWFCYFDVVNTEMLRSQSYILMPYLPYTFAMWHLLFAGFAWPKLKYPSAAYEAAMKELKNKQLQSAVLRDIQPSVRAHIRPTTMVLDVFPLMLDILTPTLRPVSTQLYTKREKDELNQLVCTMIDYNLTYVQERSFEGSYSYNLDPNIEELVRFPGLKPSRVLTYGSKQLIAREVELEKMRRSEARLQESQRNDAASQKAKNAAERTAAQNPGSMPNHLQKLQPKAVNVESDLPATDFFGRVVQRVVKTNKIPTDEIVKSDIWFHFKVGFNNAVRRSVKVKDLL